MKYYNVAETCRITGKTRNTIYAAYNRGEFPNAVGDIGGSGLMIPATDIRTWLQSAIDAAMQEAAAYRASLEEVAV